MPTIALVPWLGTGTREDPFIPQGLRQGVDVIDLRPDSGVAAGWALASFQEGLDLPPDAVLVGTSMKDTVTAQTKGRLARELGANLPDASTVDSLIVALMLTPPPGKWNRVQADHRGMLRVHLGEWSFSMPEVLAAFHYETFDQADSTTVGPRWTWTELKNDWRVVGSMLTCIGNDQLGTIRGEVTTDTDNMWCEVDWYHANGTVSTPAGTAGPICRYQAASDSGYFFELHASTNNYYFGKLTNGSLSYFASNLATPSEVAAMTTPQNGSPTLRMRTQADGSSISCSVDMYPVHTVTDTAYPSGRRGGVIAYDASDDARFSEVRIADIRVASKTSTLTEDFSRGALYSDKWEWVTSSGVTLEDGGAYLAHTAGYSGMGSVRRNLVDSYLAAAVKPGDVVAGSKRTDVVAVRESGSSNELAIQRDGDQLQMWVSTGGRRDQTSIVYDPTEHAWRRFRFSGGTAYFDTSPDGKAWTSRASKLVTGWEPGNVQTVFQAGDWSGTGAGDTIRTFFDNLNVLPLVYASDQQWVQVSTDYGTTQKDRSYDGNPLRIRGVTYSKGFGTHNSDIRVPVPPNAQTFSVVIGQDDEIASSDGQYFEVWNADKTTRLYASPLLQKSSPAVTVELDVSAQTELRLVTLQNANNGWDHADWADAKFTAQSALVLGGTVAPEGTVARAVQGKALAASVALTGTLATTRVITRAFSGAVALAGTLAERLPTKRPSGALRPAGTLARTATKRPAGTVATVGTFDWTPSKILTGTVATAGSLLTIFLARAFGRAGIVAMTVRAAGEVRLRLRRAW